MLGDLSLANSIAELQAIEANTRRLAEKDAALRENNRDRLIDYDSREALARGDLQRSTGKYIGSVNLITCAWCFALIADDDETHECEPWKQYELDRLADDGGPHCG